MGDSKVVRLSCEILNLINEYKDSLYLFYGFDCSMIEELSDMTLLSMAIRDGIKYEKHCSNELISAREMLDSLHKND